jgi:hypothetical protein
LTSDNRIIESNGQQNHWIQRYMRVNWITIQIEIYISIQIEIFSPENKCSGKNEMLWMRDSGPTVLVLSPCWWFREVCSWRWRVHAPHGDDAPFYRLSFLGMFVLLRLCQIYYCLCVQPNLTKVLVIVSKKYCIQIIVSVWVHRMWRNLMHFHIHDPEILWRASVLALLGWSGSILALLGWSFQGASLL